MSDPRGGEPARRKIQEPPEAMMGWRAADLSEDELVDDDFIVNDPTNDYEGQN